jgi:lipopolysaccharide transport system permease protein
VRSRNEYLILAPFALSTSLFTALARRRGPLRVYQWLWLVCCVVGALAIAAPRILSQPLIYTASAAVQLEAAQRYRELYTNGVPDGDYQAVQFQAIAILKARYPDVGGPTFGVRFLPGQAGQIQIEAIGRTPAEARALADEAAEELARHVRAAGGREILRNLMGWEQVVALGGNPPDSPFQAVLRDLVLTTAFPLNRAIEPLSDQLTVDQLPPEELSDLTRALEVRYDQITLIDIPNTERARVVSSEPSQIAQYERDLQRLRAGSSAIRQALAQLYLQYGAIFNPDAPSDAMRSMRAVLPAAPVDRRIPLLLALTLAGGLLFGGAGVAIDQSAGAIRKINELWEYRALIQNLVLRDLRVRYKSSVLGYLWTQLAPLLTMLIYWFVFGSFFPSDIAMYPVYLIVALLPWNFAAEAVSSGARSVIDNASLIKKVFFPREVLPLVSVLSSLLNFILSLPVLFLVMAVVQALYPPLRDAGRLINFSWTFAYLPVLLVIQMIFLAGVVMLVSAIAVFFRDAVHLIGILVQFWFFLTPVVYKLEMLGELPARILRWLNPMASLVEFYREILYGGAVMAGAVPTPGLPALESIVRVLLTGLALLAIGYWFFQRRSGEFGEEL